MAKEIERKFLVAGNAWRDAAQSSRTLLQAYLAIDGETSARVRILDGEEAWLTVKLGVSEMTRDEFEYPVPLDDARTMVEASRGRVIEKTRHIIKSDGYVWEVDVFEGALAGLVMAEVEMGAEDETPALPSWLGREVTGDPAWTNAALATEGWPEGIHL
ncbi:CYTH domain-containing protein [Hoeflea sp.]|uniref:CYTH domain-containing protein n=1 Tax=Hoeflea sp. TaxID=1940281 RepID=UPI0019C4E77E|nr:CYTH domain-containing protein [Hoeflea sp.]MBC7284846.1 CYTH domain-containing protein [Hoeflea sp.]